MSISIVPAGGNPSFVLQLHVGPFSTKWCCWRIVFRRRSSSKATSWAYT